MDSLKGLIGFGSRKQAGLNQDNLFEGPLYGGSYNLSYLY